MNLTPFANASLVIQIHTFLALGAVALTIGIFCLRKGSPLHRTIGWAWVLMMGCVALSSFWINELRVVGLFSPIHLLSLLTLWTLVRGVTAARAHHVKEHKRQMKTLVFGALIAAGAFTFFPGRLMHAVFLGG